MRTLFLNPPAYDNFDGGAGSRYQATREVWSFWYPTWLCYPAGMIQDSRVLDAPPEGLSQAQSVAIAKAYDFVVLHTSTPSFKMDVQTAQMIKDSNPGATVAFVGGHPTAMPEQTLQASTAIDIAARKEFDWSMKELAEGLDWAQIQGISYRKNGRIVHNPERTPMTGDELDTCPLQAPFMPATSTSASITAPTVSTRMCPCTPAVAVRPAAPSASGPRSRPATPTGPARWTT